MTDSAFHRALRLLCIAPLDGPVVPDGSVGYVIQARGVPGHASLVPWYQVRRPGGGAVVRRARLPGGRGTWPAIWMLPTDQAYGGWPASGEIDIMEHVGYDPGRIHVTMHTGAYNHRIGTQKTATRVIDDPTTRFHRYRVDWTPDTIRGYIDDVQVYEFVNEGTGPAAWPFDRRFHVAERSYGARAGEFPLRFSPLFSPRRATRPRRMTAVPPRVRSMRRIRRPRRTRGLRQEDSWDAVPRIGRPVRCGL